MARRRKYTNRLRRKSSTPRAKPVKLDPEVWLKDSKAIAAYRESLLIDQDYMCAISGLPITGDNSCLDHAHAGSPSEVDGKVRGCLENSTNALEGMFLSKFNKLKMRERYGLDFPQFLINMGEYLQQDNNDKPYHYKYMSDLRNHIKRLNREEIVDKLLKEFNIKESPTTEKGELVRRYTKEFVDTVERLEKEK